MSTDYEVELFFNDLDSNMYTTGGASVVMTVKADDYKTAELIAERLQKVLGSDHYEIT